MVPLIEQHQDEIRALCREYGVVRLEVFGSACTAEFDPERSDVDFLVEYPEGYDVGPWLQRFQGLQADLARLLGRPVDLVMTSGLRKPRFVQAVNKTRRVIYDATDVARIA